MAYKYLGTAVEDRGSGRTLVAGSLDSVRDEADSSKASGLEFHSPIDCG